jgi:hypothetical protein
VVQYSLILYHCHYLLVVSCYVHLYFLNFLVSYFGLLYVCQSSLLPPLGSFVFFNFCLFFILGSLAFNLFLSFAMGSFVSWSLDCISFLAPKFHDHFCFVSWFLCFMIIFFFYYKLVICFVILACEAHKCKSCKFFLVVLVIIVQACQSIPFVTLEHEFLRFQPLHFFFFTIIFLTCQPQRLVTRYQTSQ